MNQSRRDFLTKSGYALGMGALATQVGHFGMMSALAQESSKESSMAPTDYKALVCIFLDGGNDANNMIIPNHSDASISGYAAYSAERGPSTLAIPQANLLPITVPRMGNLSYGLHPSFGTVAGGINPGIHPLWATGKLGAVTNVGTLVVPLTRATYGSNPKPSQLYSHSDQVNQYQIGRANGQEFTGWGGKMADRMNTCSNPAGLVPMITSISGTNLFTNGSQTLPMAINNAGTALNNVLALSMSSPNAADRLSAFNALRTMDLDSNVVRAASNITSQAVQANQALATWQEVTAPFPTTGIGQQLKQIARLIKKRTELSINRQIFYARIGGFDTHSNQNQGGQVTLFSQLSQAMRAFYDEMVVQGMENNVMQFTLSDFSRTFNPAGSGTSVGTDHGWGSHQFILGGALVAADFYGMNGSNGTPFNQLVKGAADDADNGAGARGRWIPSTSVEQYAATLARWYGLDPAQLPQVFPNINNFGGNTNLGFLPASGIACA